jgi:hypothetical protein
MEVEEGPNQDLIDGNLLGNGANLGDEGHFSAV